MRGSDWCVNSVAEMPEDHGYSSPTAQLQNATNIADHAADFSYEYD